MFQKVQPLNVEDVPLPAGPSASEVKHMGIYTSRGQEVHPPGAGSQVYVLELFYQKINGWDAGSPKFGGIPVAYGAPPNEGKDYKWYISGIFPANWGMDYAT